MATTLRIVEGIPDSYPQVVEPAPLADSQIEKLAINAWQRVEAYIATRWNSRSVEYIAEGPGEWYPKLAPTTISTVEVWRNYQWETTTLNPDPLGGYELPGEGPYRFTGVVGSTNEPPRAVKNAVFRLFEYFLAVDETPRSQRVTRTFKTDQEPYVEPEYGQWSYRTAEREFHNPQWVARALQYSGAADLLRPYRKLGTL